MTIKEIYKALNAMVETLGLKGFSVRIYGVNDNEYRIDANTFCDMYREKILGTEYENATIHKFEHAWSFDGIMFALNGKVLAQLTDNLECDMEWLCKHFYEVYADDEPFRVVDEIYNV